MRRLIVPLVLVFLTCAPLGARQTTYRSYGAGLRPCQSWINNRADPAAHLINLSWVLGFVSGAAWDARELRETDFMRVEAWMDQFCKRDPSSSIAKAATGLVEELRR